MSKTLQLGDISIQLTRKAVKHVHLSVHPPEGRVSLVAPISTRAEVARAYAISKLAWIRTQRAKFAEQARESPCRFVGRETHYLWGRRYLLSVEHQDAKPRVRLDHRRVTLVVRPGSTQAVRARVMHEWHKSLLHQIVPRLIAKWESRLRLRVAGYFLQHMKTKWGGCNHKAGHIRLNTELVKKPKDLLEYVIVHEMIHLIEPRHSDHFLAILQRHYPAWREARLELNDLPLAAEVWARNKTG
jgi:predicted metal-dependent hydrolase